MKQFLALIVIVLCATTVLAAVGHDASQVRPGQFAAGNYSFQQNVGIGTASPSAGLTVYGTGFNGRIDIKDTDGTPDGTY